MCFRLFGVEHQMPLFYVETCGANPWVDDAGLEISDLDAARCEAIRFCGESTRDMKALIWAEPSFQVNARDADRRCVITLSSTASNPLQEVTYEEAQERAA